MNTYQHFNIKKREKNKITVYKDSKRRGGAERRADRLGVGAAAVRLCRRTKRSVPRAPTCCFVTESGVSF